MTTPNGTFLALLSLLGGGNPPVTGAFCSQRPVTRNFGVFFDLIKRLGKQSGRWWCETPLRSLWRRCNGWLTSVVIVCWAPALRRATLWTTRCTKPMDNAFSDFMKQYGQYQGCHHGDRPSSPVQVKPLCRCRNDYNAMKRRHIVFHVANTKTHSSYEW